ncbi:MAG: type III pantothenate kinase [Acholeplasmatales bacterium]|nr:type III pantothenate kinase [Acholeplasmatales bacterium]
MILAVDMGNTNIVVGIVEKNRIIASGRVGTDRMKTNMDLLIQIKTILEVFNVKPTDIDGAILSSVVPELTNQLASAMELLINKKVLILGHGVKTGLNIKIDNPQTLGADRVADAVGAIEKYGYPLVIVDMGTATTISVIDKNKSYIGGLIIPGIKTSMGALSNNASQLPHISLEEPKAIVGRNTIDCMRSGIVYGTAAMIDGLLDKIKDELGYDFTIITTGGLSSLIIPYMSHKVNYEEYLLLMGLYQIYEKNQER